MNKIFMFFVKVLASAGAGLGFGCAMMLLTDNVLPSPYVFGTL